MAVFHYSLGGIFMTYGVINFIYKNNKSWNCSRVCETKKEFFEWVDMEKEYNKIEFVKDNIVNCYIDF